MNALSLIFTWWNGHTIGTWLDTRRHGHRVGEDEQGNVYYQTADGKRRWVMYNGEAEASRISPDWHGWMHHTYDAPPTTAPLPKKAWEKAHLPNLTGTAAAYAPPGAVMTARPAAKAGAAYEAWSPE